MKGTYSREELERAPAGFRLSALHPLSVPGLAAARHLVMITHG